MVLMDIGLNGDMETPGLVLDAVEPPLCWICMPSFGFARCVGAVNANEDPEVDWSQEGIINYQQAGTVSFCHLTTGVLVKTTCASLVRLKTSARTG